MDVPTLTALAAPATTCDTSVVELEELLDELPDELPGFDAPWLCFPPCELDELEEPAAPTCADELDAVAPDSC